MFCQLSILAFYLRLVTSNTTKVIIWILMAAVTCFGLGNTFSMVLQCMPISFFWDGWRGEMIGKCTVDIRLFGFIRGGIEIVLDLIILTIPLPMLSKLQMSTRKKLQIMSMFCILADYLVDDNVSGVYWCVTEANLFVVVACMPAMRPIFQKILPTVFVRSQVSGYANNDSAYGQKSGNSLPFGVIHKSLDVKVHREDRSESDIELMERPSYM
ncbi:hypothetical protein N0V90_005808 [Kalmusia sp. IMI 367209]|nr:hypothetical protein N0V90_005808 [Kalmusia sp. IMI 367209]